MKKLLLIPILLLCLPIVLAANTYCIALDSGTVCMNTTSMSLGTQNVCTDTNGLCVGVGGDTNETVRVGRIVSTNCTGQVVAGFYSNGTGWCEADDTGALAAGKEGDGIYLYNDSTIMYFNETKLNATIDARDTDTTYTNGTGLNLTGTTFSILQLLYNNWNLAYSWGNHAIAGYLTSYTETDPSWSANYTNGYNKTAWDTAYSWGDHSGAGYLTVESDPTWAGNSSLVLYTSQVTTCNSGNYSAFNGTNFICSPDQNTGSGAGGHTGTGYLYNDTTYMYLNETLLNATIDARDTDTYNTSAQMIAATNNTLNALSVACGNVTGATSNLCTITGGADTNETPRVNNITASNCSTLGDYHVAGFYTNGTAFCDADTTGAGAGDGTGGWTNTSTTTSTSLVVNITDNMADNPLNIVNGTDVMFSIQPSGAPIMNKGSGYNLVAAGVNAGPPSTWVPTNDYGTVSLGHDSLTSLTTGSGNFGMGGYSLQDCTTCSWSVGLGVYTLSNNIDGDGNIGIGYYAGNSLNTGSDNNIAIGRGAMSSVAVASGADENIGIGSDALDSLTDGDNNVAVGLSAGNTLSTGKYNSILGGGALKYTAAGNGNTAVGYFAGNNNNAGDYNTYLGYQAGGYGATKNSQSRNTMIGYRSGLSTTTATNNILIGYLAGDALTTGDYNIVIGDDIDVPNATSNYQLNIGGLITGITSGATSGVTIASPASTGVPLTLKGAAAQSANLQEWKNSAGTTLALVDENGYLGIGSDVANPGQALHIDGRIRLEAGAQNGDIYLDTNGRILFDSITAFIPFYHLIINSSGTEVSLGHRLGTSTITLGESTLGPTLQLYGETHATYPGKAYLRTGTDSGSNAFYADSDGTISFGSVSDYQAQIAINNTNGSNKGLIIQGAAAQSANLQEWQNSTGGVMASVQADGDFNLTRTGQCIYMPGGGRLCGNTTCTTIYSPDGLSKVEACN